MTQHPHSSYPAAPASPAAAGSTPVPPPRRHTWLLVTLAVVAILALATSAAAVGLVIGSRSAGPAVAASTTPKAPSRSSAPAIDAAAILARVMAAGAGATGGAVQTVADDPNHLVGTAGGYLSRAAFDLPGGDPAGEPHGIARGGVIEVWVDEQSATNRSAFILGVKKGLPALTTEVHVQHGSVLVRVVAKADKVAADRVAAVVRALP